MSTLHNTLPWTPTALKVDWRRWAHPHDVVSDPTMSVAEKRELLASWASDARAVPNFPALRQLDSGHLISVDSVLWALKKLDGLEEQPQPAPKAREVSKKGHRSRVSRLWRHRSSDDDDDDGPTSPAPAGILPLPPLLDGAVALAA